MNLLLPLLIGLPLLTASILILLPCPPQWARPIGLCASIITAIIAGFTLLNQPWSGADRVLHFNLPWVPSLGIRFHLQLDGLATPLVLLTALLGVAVLLVLPEIKPHQPPMTALVAVLLAIQAGAMASFLAADLLLFLISFELVLVPMWALIRWWGDRQTSGHASTRFVLYNVFGSGVMLLGILLLRNKTGSSNLIQLTQLQGRELNSGSQLLIAALLLGGLAVKVPVWPLHTWLPSAHTAAPTVGSILLAGVLLKLGSYGMIRLVLPVVPDGFSAVAPYLAGCSVVGILWGGLICLRERDLKRLVAYSSVAHMGFVTLALTTGTPRGLQAALFANIAHGILTALLFLAVGAVKDRLGQLQMAALGGLRERAPRLGALLALGAIGSLGMPGLVGFWGEFLAISAAWSGPSGSTHPWVWLLLAALAAVGTALAAGYLLRMLRLTWHGNSPIPMTDLTPAEWTVGLTLAALALGLGLAPVLLLGLTEPVVTGLLAMLTGRVI